MTPAEAAAQMNGREYREEGSREWFASLKAAGLVAVYGASDDLMEFGGAIDDEVGCYGGGSVKITPTGILDPNDDLYNRAEKAAFPEIKAHWDAGDGFSWTYETTIPHETFLIVEDGEPYCRGIVFRLADAVSA